MARLLPAASRLGAAWLLAAILGLASLPSLIHAQGYWVIYPSSCFNVCYGNNVCIGNCNTCLLYTWSCYATFLPYYGSNGAYTGFACQCYVPWWGWFILAIGLFIVLICCPVIIIYFCCKGGMKMWAAKQAAKKAAREKADEVEAQAQAYVPGSAPGPVPVAMPPPPPAQYAPQ